MKDDVLNIAMWLFVMLMLAMVHWVGLSKGERTAYDNCIEYNKAMSVADAQKFCKNIVYGESK